MEKLTVILLVLGVGAVYLLTLPLGIGFGDSGTMAAAAVSLGIPHPPGFPAYVVLGHLFSLLPLGPLLWRLQLLSVLGAVGTVFVVYKITRSLPAAFLTAFFYGFWSQAGNVESYSLTFLAIFGLIWLCRSGTPGWLLGIILGLTAGLNPIGVVVIPVILYLFKLSKKTLIIFTFAMPIVILVYAYLPLRAAAHPFLNWGDPQTLPALIKHLTGGGLNISSSTVINGFTVSARWFFDAWARFGLLAFNQLTPVVLGLSLLGMINLWQKQRRDFWLWIILLAADLTLAGIYISGNRDIWLVIGLMVLLIFAAEGIKRLGKWGTAAGIIALAMVLWLSAPKILDRAKTDIAGQYLADLYRNLPENTILIGGGETFNALTLYAREAAKIRPDVTPVDMTIFYGQEWYRKNLQVTSYNLQLPAEKVTFLDDLEFSRVLEDFAEKNRGRPIFVTGYLLTQPVYANSLQPAYVPQNFHLQQKGLVYQLVKTDAPPVELENYPAGWKVDSYRESNYRKALDIITTEYAFALEKTGDYFLRLGEEKAAFDRFARAARINSQYFDQNRLREKIARTASPNAVPSER